MRPTTSRATCCAAPGSSSRTTRPCPTGPRFWLPCNRTSSQQHAVRRAQTADRATTPDGSVIHPTYNEANLLERVDVNLRGAQASDAIRHQHRLQRQGPAHAHRVRQQCCRPLTPTIHDLPPDPPTTTRQGFCREHSRVQDLTYTYDPPATSPTSRTMPTSRTSFSSATGAWSRATTTPTTPFTG